MLAFSSPGRSMDRYLDTPPTVAGSSMPGQISRGNPRCCGGVIDAEQSGLEGGVFSISFAQRPPEGQYVLHVVQRSGGPPVKWILVTTQRTSGRTAEKVEGEGSKDHVWHTLVDHADGGVALLRTLMRAK